MPSASISNEIATTLRAEILRQRYAEGERLPSERDLAARFDASRGAVREALLELSQSGLISIQPGGVRVQPIIAARLSVLGPLMALDDVPDPQLVDQFLQTFGMLTAMTAKNAVEKADPAQHKMLLGQVNALAGQSTDFESMEPQWRDLLQSMATVDDNLVIRLIGNDLKAQFVGQMMELGIKPVMNHSAGTEFINTLHMALVERDGFLASEAIRKYFDQLRSAIVKAIKQLRDEDANQEAELFNIRAVG